MSATTPKGLPGYATSGGGWRAEDLLSYPELVERSGPLRRCYLALRLASGNECPAQQRGSHVVDVSVRGLELRASGATASVAGSSSERQLDSLCCAASRMAVPQGTQ